MVEIKVDRAVLEANSTEEIIRILQEERDDYTPEAIKIFEEILRERRGQDVYLGGSERDPGKSEHLSPVYAASREPLIRRPVDAVRVLNDLLGAVLNGSMEPETAQVASGIVMGILRAMEQEFMTESEEGSG
ncbi:MAG: hypothetical protein WBG50_06610 [Desulfomonilaceae bacterium]